MRGHVALGLAEYHYSWVSFRQRRQGWLTGRTTGLTPVACPTGDSPEDRKKKQARRFDLVSSALGSLSSIYLAVSPRHPSVSLVESVVYFLFVSVIDKAYVWKYTDKTRRLHNSSSSLELTSCWYNCFRKTMTRLWGGGLQATPPPHPPHHPPEGHSMTD